MYVEYFGLKEEPFNLAHEPRFLYLSEGHKEAIARLQFGIEMRKGLLVLTGEVGSGKSTIIQTLLANKKPDQNTALIMNSRILGNRLLQNICREFGIDLDFSQMSKADILNILYEFILKKSFYDQNFLIIIDDAHDLNKDQFDDILLLTKIETHTRQLLQIILVGLPELLQKLKAPELLPVHQRIQLRYHLKPLSYSDTQNYLFHRLAVAGQEKQELFKAEAVQRIFQLSRGIPRTISVIASNALLYAYLHGLKKIDFRAVNQSTDESLQPQIETADGEDTARLQDKFPLQLKDKPPSVRRKRRWFRWLIIGFIITIFFILLNIIAQYLIEYFELF